MQLTFMQVWLALFKLYFVCITITTLVFGIRLLSRRAFMLIPVKVCFWIFIPLVLLELVVPFQFYGSFAFGLFLALGLLGVVIFLVGLWFVRRTLGVLIFNCEQSYLIELIAQILHEQAIPFSQQRATFFINDQGSMLRLQKGLGDFSALNARGEKSYFPAVLEKLKASLQHKRIAKFPVLAFLAIFEAIVFLGMMAQMSLGDALSLDLRSYGDVVQEIGMIGVYGFYIGWLFMALLFLGMSIRSFIPRPFIIRKPMLRWGMLVFAAWGSMILLMSLTNDRLYFIFIFYTASLAILLVFLDRHIYGHAVWNLAVEVVLKNLKDIFNHEQLQFEEIGNELRLRSGASFYVSPGPPAYNVAVEITDWKLEPKLHQIENLLFREVKKQPGRASMQNGLLFLALAIIPLAYGSFPFLMHFLTLTP